MLQVSYSEREMLGDNHVFLKLNLYICIKPGRFSPTPICNSGDCHTQAKGCRMTVAHDTQQ